MFVALGTGDLDLQAQHATGPGGVVVHVVRYARYLEVVARCRVSRAAVAFILAVSTASYCRQGVATPGRSAAPVAVECTRMMANNQKYARRGGTCGEA